MQETLEQIENRIREQIYTEIASKKREERIEELTNRLLENEFYPFSYRHFYGALAQMPDDIIGRYIVDLAVQYDSDPFGAQYAKKLGEEIVREVKTYWRNAAREEAERRVPPLENFVKKEVEKLAPKS